MKKVLLKIKRGGKIGGTLVKLIEVDSNIDSEAKKIAEEKFLKEYANSGGISYGYVKISDAKKAFRLTITSEII